MKIFKITYSLFLVFSCFLLCNLSGCAFKAINRYRNITYSNSKPNEAQQLNIFTPRSRAGDIKEVFVFIYGGSWNSGKKSLYSFLGSRMARKGVVTVIIDYPLSPQANYNHMAIASATAVKWVQENIKNFGGNPDKIFVSGHSAGGHLAALITVRNAYFDTLGVENPIKGAILIDAAGLDMYGYLLEEKLPAGHTYLQTFTTNPVVWKEASPLYHLHSRLPPFLIYRGEKTYPSIIKSNEKFVTALKGFKPELRYQVIKGKKHIPMITQFIKPWNPLYSEIITFMQVVK